MMTRAFPAANLAVIRGFALPFGLLAGALALGVLVFFWLGIVIDADSWRTVVLIVAIASGLVLASAWLGNETATASALSLALFLMMPASLAVFSYACVGIGAGVPLRDAALTSIDSGLGFDWIAAIDWFNQSPTLVWLLGKAYHGTIVPLIYALVLLNIIGRRDRIVQFMVLLIGTCLLANILSGLIPASGAYVHLRPDEAVRGAISADAGIWHLAHFEALRAGGFTHFSLKETKGLVTFPSFHTAAALCVPLALRGLGAVTALAWAVAGAIVVSTIPIGGHYLIDVVAGGAMTVALHGLIVKARVGQGAMRQAGADIVAPNPSSEVSTDRADGVA